VENLKGAPSEHSFSRAHYCFEEYYLALSALTCALEEAAEEKAALGSVDQVPPSPALSPESSGSQTSS
jgi:hypothetical protein